MFNFTLYFYIFLVKFVLFPTTAVGTMMARGAQEAMARPEHARLERAVADPIVNKPILKAVAQPTRPAHDRGPGTLVSPAAEHLLGGTYMRPAQPIVWPHPTPDLRV